MSRSRALRATEVPFERFDSLLPTLVFRMGDIKAECRLW